MNSSHYTRNLLRDAVIRTYVLPDQPRDWPRLSDAADDIVRLDLVTVPAVADWLDGIHDQEYVAAFLAVRHAQAALGREIIRRVEAQPIDHAYLRCVEHEDPEALENFATLLKLRRRRGDPIKPNDQYDEQTSTAMEHVLRLYRAPTENIGEDYEAWMASNVFRRLRPNIDPHWDQIGSQFLVEDIAQACAIHLPVLDGRASSVRTALETEQRGNRRRLYLMRVYDPIDVHSEAPPSALEALETAQHDERQSARLDRLEAHFGAVWGPAVRAIMREITDEQGAELSGQPLRTFQLRKAEIRKRLDDLSR